jgi:hypothetical protein
MEKLNMFAQTDIKEEAVRDGQNQCVVAVGYEDDETRDRAVALCDGFSRRLWQTVEFDFSWWRFSHLEDSLLFAAAQQAACDSDIIVVSARAGGEWPVMVRRWFEVLARDRTASAGALVGLFQESVKHPADASGRRDYLQRIARRARMDWFDRDTLQAQFPFEDAAKAMEARATEVTPMLERMLRTPPPSRWGINE